VATTWWRGRGRVRIALLALTAVVVAGCGPVVELELPSADLRELSAAALPVESVVVDAAGNELAVLRREFRRPVTLGTIPRHLVEAVLTAEDRRFMDHRGVDARSILRAALRNLATGDVEQGGSTITQQLIKTRYMPDADRSMRTKLVEAQLALQMEQERTKADILEEYLDTAYLGEGAYGFGAAAWTYFRKDVADLELHESALLAAIVRAPEAFGPNRAPQAALTRRDDLLWRMAADGWITPAERDAATARPLETHERPGVPEAKEPHLVDLVVRTLLADPSFGRTEEERAARLYGGGLTIHTTIRPELQAAARAALAQHLPDPDDPEAALAAVEPSTGHLVAAVGNRSYEDLQFDLVTQARRQPGSTFKSFVLAAAISDGWRPDDVLDGRQGTIATPTGGWEVRNYDLRSYPRVTLAGATRASVNTAFARLGLAVGLDRVAGLARAMGVTGEVPPDDAQLTIGGGGVAVTTYDLASAFATFGNLGTRIPVTAIARIEDAQGRVVWQPDQRPQPVLDASAAYVTLEVLTDVVEHGTGLNARVADWQVAGKTGTTSDYADAWFAGTTTALAAAVWVGHAEGRVPLHDIQGVRRVTGGSIPASVFATFTADALADLEPTRFELPDAEWRVVEIDAASGLLAAAWCPGEAVRIPAILAPTETCPEPPPPPPPAPRPAPEPEPEPEPAEPEEPDEPAEPDGQDGDPPDVDPDTGPGDGPDAEEAEPTPPPAADPGPAPPAGEPDPDDDPGGEQEP
jgi:membrane peptidoglycan carboxypeptidase